MDDIAGPKAVQEIRNLKARYFRAIDEKDGTLLRDVFANEVVLDYRGSTTDPATGIAIVGDATGQVLQGADQCVPILIAALTGVVSVHHASEPEIEVQDHGNASAIWPMVDRLLFPEGGPVREMIGYGHYRETYVREQGKWRIKTLRLTRLRLDFVPA